MSQWRVQVRKPHRARITCLPSQSKNSIEPQNSFQFEKFVQTGFTPFAAIAGLLVPSEAGSKIQARVIDMYVAGAKPICNAARSFPIRRSYICGQTIFRIVRNGNGFVFIAVRNDTDYRSEYFFAGDSHVIGNRRKDRRLDEIAGRDAFWPS